MRTYSPAGPELEVLGALALAEGPGGWRPSRVPPGYRRRIPTDAMLAMVDCAAGVRVRFASRATCITVVMTASPVRFEGVAGPWPSRVDLLVDGRRWDSQEAATGDAVIAWPDGALSLSPGEPVGIEFAGLPSRDKVVEIWLPHTAIVDLIGISADEPVRRMRDGRPRWIHYGSSISHCLEAGAPTRAWPALASGSLSLDLLDLAFAGQAMLDPFMARVIRDQRAELITLKLGINPVNADAMNQRVFHSAVDGFIDTIREGHPRTPIVVISPIECPCVEDIPGPTVITVEHPVARSAAVPPYRSDALTLTWIRAELAAVVRERSADDPCIFSVDGRELFGREDVAQGLLPDGLHPDESGYALMAERFARLLPGLARFPLPTPNESE